ncbi:MAG TPA: ATP synthase F1 subunit epsilon [bacterium]|nr:ATP synthase F1 subunit epsilon [bacterium]
MKIEIVTPYQHIVSDEAEELYAVGPKGEFGILPGHAHYVTPLETGRLFYRKGGKRHAFVVQGGFLEAYEEKILVMADHVEKAENIDLPQAKQELEKLEKQLAQGSIEGEDFNKLQSHRLKEQVRVQAASEAG